MASVTISDSVVEEMTNDLVANEDRIREELQQHFIEEEGYAEDGISEAQAKELYEKVSDVLNNFYSNARSAFDELEEKLSAYVDKIPFVTIDSIEKLWEDIKKAVDIGVVIVGAIAFFPIVAFWADKHEHFAVKAINSIGLILIGGAMIQQINPAFAVAFATAYGVATTGFAYDDLKPELQDAFEKAKQ